MDTGSVSPLAGRTLRISVLVAGLFWCLALPIYSQDTSGNRFGVSGSYHYNFISAHQIADFHLVKGPFSLLLGGGISKNWERISYKEVEESWKPGFHIGLAFRFPQNTAFAFTTQINGYYYFVKERAWPKIGPTGEWYLQEHGEATLALGAVYRILKKVEVQVGFGTQFRYFPFPSHAMLAVVYYWETK